MAGHVLYLLRNDAGKASSLQEGDLRLCLVQRLHRARSSLCKHEMTTDRRPGDKAQIWSQPGSPHVAKRYDSHSQYQHDLWLVCLAIVALQCCAAGCQKILSFTQQMTACFTFSDAVECTEINWIQTAISAEDGALRTTVRKFCHSPFSQAGGTTGHPGVQRMGKQDCPLRLTLFGILFDSLYQHMSAAAHGSGLVLDSGRHLPFFKKGLCDAGDVVLLPEISQEVQHFSMHSFCVSTGLAGASGVVISVASAELMAFNDVTSWEASAPDIYCVNCIQQARVPTPSFRPILAG